MVESLREETYGYFIRKARESAGLSRKEAALRLGMSEDGLLKVEHDKNGTTLKKLQAMAQLYRCEVGDLFPRTVEVAPIPDDIVALVQAVAFIPESVKNQLVRSWVQQANMLARALTAEVGPPALYTKATLATKIEPAVDDAALQQDGDAFARVPRRGAVSTGEKGVKKRGG